MKYFSVIFLIIYILYFSFSQFNIKNIRVNFLDVGQGDAILVQLPRGYDILIDGGEGDEVIIEMGKLMAPWDRSIELMVLTHPHLDHLGGLMEVAKRFEVKEVWLNPIGYKTPEFLVFVSILYTDINIGRIIFPYEGFTNSVKGGTIKVVWPREKSKYGSFIGFAGYMNGVKSQNGEKSKYSGSEVNNSSIVLLLSYGNIDFLLAGDAEIESEGEYIIGFSKNIDIEVLKAGHHCSRTATSEKLLTKLNPELAICSVGKDNKFGHPHSETIEKFKEKKIEYLLTELEGTISIETDGINWWVK